MANLLCLSGGDPSTLSPTGLESSDKVSEQLVGASPSVSIEKVSLNCTHVYVSHLCIKRL